MTDAPNNRADQLEATFSAICPRAHLNADCEYFRTEYENAEPYPHLVIDGLYDPAILDRICAEFPKRQDRDWIVWDTEHHYKTTSRGTAGLSTFTQLFFLLHQSTDFIDLLERITGLDRLLPDPMFYGAGLHETFRGGWLDIHSDYTRHPVLPLKRRVNILIYLNRNWEQDWGGDIELWNNNTLQKASYAPLFNRTLIFPTTTDTLHGHPVRLTCPKDRSRRLILIYYWSAIPSDDKKAQPLRWYSGEPDTWEKNFELWEKNFESTISAISNLIPRYDTFVLVDDGKLLSDDRFADYNVIPFLEKDGKYFGAPPDDATAISEFERVRGLNASFIVFAWPAFWWLTHYTKFHQHLRAKFPCVLENDSHMIFDLCP